MTETELQNWMNNLDSVTDVIISKYRISPNTG